METKSFGKFVRDRINALGKSQKDLAMELEVSPAYISQIIGGKKSPPDLSKHARIDILKTWCDFLDVSEEDLLALIRYELFHVPMKPTARYHRLRDLLLKKVSNTSADFAEEIKSLEFHPAESSALKHLVQLYFIMQEDPEYCTAFGPKRFRDFCLRVASNKEFIERELVDFFKDQSFQWYWDDASTSAKIVSESSFINEAFKRLDNLLGTENLRAVRGAIPVVGHVSAGEGFSYTDGGYSPGDGFELVDSPPGIDPALGPRLYCVRVRGDSLREFFGDGTLLFIKPESWEEIKDGDLVIFKDRRDEKAFVKKVEFSGESLILKSMNPMYKNMVVSKGDLLLLERVLAVVF